MSTIKLALKLCAAMGAVTLLHACGGGGDGSAAPATGNAGPAANTTGPATPPPPAVAAPAFPGFDFVLSPGTFWEYRWDSMSRSSSSGGTSTTEGKGRFWLVLGEPQPIAGVQAYPVQVLGKSEGANRSFKPRWKFLALKDQKLMGSVDGNTLQTVFDANTGKWTGGGFFTELRSDRLTVAAAGTLRNDYLTTPAVAAGMSLSRSQCEFFSGIGTICGGDSSQTVIDKDYFQAGVGPVGYHYENNASYSGGGFFSVHNWLYRVGLTASSLQGRVLPLIAEDPVAHATPQTAQQIRRGESLRGDVALADAATAGSVLVTAVTRPVKLHDWYAVSVTGPASVLVTLSFESARTADLDLYVSGSTATGPSWLCTGLTDNPAARIASETVKCSLPTAGVYYIAVSASKAPTGRVAYELQVE